MSILTLLRTGRIRVFVTDVGFFTAFQVWTTIMRLSLLFLCLKLRMMLLLLVLCFQRHNLIALRSIWSFHWLRLQGIYLLQIRLLLTLILLIIWICSGLVISALVALLCLKVLISYQNLVLLVLRVNNILITIWLIIWTVWIVIYLLLRCLWVVKIVCVDIWIQRSWRRVHLFLISDIVLPLRLLSWVLTSFTWVASGILLRHLLRDFFISRREVIWY